MHSVNSRNTEEKKGVKHKAISSISMPPSQCFPRCFQMNTSASPIPARGIPVMLESNSLSYSANWSISVSPGSSIPLRMYRNHRESRTRSVSCRDTCDREDPITYRKLGTSSTAAMAPPQIPHSRQFPLSRRKRRNFSFLPAAAGSPESPGEPAKNRNRK